MRQAGLPQGRGGSFLRAAHVNFGFMKALWEFVTSGDYFPPGSTSNAGRLTPGGLIFLAILLHTFAVVALVSGNMIGRRAPPIIDGRHTVPILYWIYTGFMVFGAMVFDVFLFQAWKAFVAKRTKNEI